MHNHRFATVLAAAFIMTMFASPAKAQQVESPATQMELSVNAHRSAVGLATLSRDPRLDQIATQQARRMASADRLFHNRALRAEIMRGVPDWVFAGENVGVGVEAQQIEQLFLESPSHRANIERYDFQQLGIGVAFTPDARIYMVQVFARTSGWGREAAPTVDRTHAEESAPPASVVAAPNRPLALAPKPAPVALTAMPGVQFRNETSRRSSPRGVNLLPALLGVSIVFTGLGGQRLIVRRRNAARVHLPPAAHGKDCRPRAMVRL